MRHGEREEWRGRGGVWGQVWRWVELALVEQSEHTRWRSVQECTPATFSLCSPYWHCPAAALPLPLCCLAQLLLPSICPLTCSFHLHLTVRLLPLKALPCPLRSLPSHTALCPLMMNSTPLILPSTSSNCTLPPHTALHLLKLHSTPACCPLHPHTALYLHPLLSYLSRCPRPLRLLQLYTLSPLSLTFPPPTPPYPLLYYLLFSPAFSIPLSLAAFSTPPPYRPLFSPLSMSVTNE